MDPTQVARRKSTDEDKRPDIQRLITAISLLLEKERTTTISRANLALRTIGESEVYMIEMNAMAKLIAIILWEGSVKAGVPAQATVNMARTLVAKVIADQVAQLFKTPPYDPRNPEVLLPAQA